MSADGASPRTGGGRAAVSRSSGLADVVELVLDKGLVIDAFIRVSLIGIEILTVDVRVVVASVDTYLRFAEATNRLDLYSQEKRGTNLPEVLETVTERGVRSIARNKTKTFVDSALEKVENALLPKH
jgi:gas vesicle structural protein